MNSTLSILLLSLYIMSSVCQELNEPLKKATKEEEMQNIKRNLQSNVTKKCHSALIIYEEVIPPTIIESDEPTDIILQRLTSETDEAEIMDADTDGSEEGLRQKRRAGRVVRVCNRRRRRRCRYVIVVRRRGRRRGH